MTVIVRRIVERVGDRATFIDGVAVECYAPYRKTHDVDVVIRERDFPVLKTCLVELGFAHRRTHLAKHTFKARDVGGVDAYTTRVGDVPVEEALFRRARTLPYAGVPVRVVSLEDLLRFKFVAGREMDLADIAVLLHERRGGVDVALVERLAGLDVLRRLAPRVPDLLPEEYGWHARRALKAWLRETGWLIIPRGRPRGR